MASDPEGIVDTLHRLARLDPVELGLAVVLDRRSGSRRRRPGCGRG